VPIKPGEKRQKRALVIEDSLVVRKTLTRVLTKLGFEAVHAVDGMEGLKKLKNSLFDVVLCDFLMPVMDGLDCVQQYREWETAHRPWFRQHIIGISAHASENDVAKGREIGMDDYKPKPVTYKQLAELEKSKEVQIVGERLDEIAAERVMMSEGNGKGGHTQGESTESTSESTVDQNDVSSSNSAIHFCLIAAEEETSDTLVAEKAAEKKGWKTVVVHNGEDALRLLKMRNWDAVLFDENLPMLGSSQCIVRFREWEENNRVTRQRNVVLVSPSCVSFACGSKSMVQLPFGFNRSLGKPVRVKDLEDIFGQAQRSEKDFGVRDIVSR
jgi:CheY-like chemotaxis protein